jgi:major membrane immunogen (membrane-anchored lipoprotein)
MLTKTGRIIAIIMLSVLLTACGANKEMVETPAGIHLERGRNYKEVIEDFEDKGFTNIKTETIPDLVYGRSFRNGEVEQISVGGDTDYDSGVRVPADTEVIIRYHTYSQKSIDDAEAKEKEKAAADEESKEE